MAFTNYTNAEYGEAVAWARYDAPHAGELLAYLKPYRIRRIWRYQWQTDRGAAIGPSSLNPFVQIRRALEDPAFSYVSCSIDLGKMIIRG